MKWMNRFTWVALIVLLHGQPALAETAAEAFREGAHYQRIDPALPLTESRERIEIVELFLYACPHCYEMEARMREWLKGRTDVDFHRMPAIVGPTWADQARAFYIIEALGGGEAMHQALFKAIHEHGKQIYNEHSVVEFFISQGVDRQKVTSLYYSPETAASVNAARIKTVKYGLRGVPAVVVNGKFKTAPFFVRNQEEMFAVLDSLVEKEKQRLAQVTKATAQED